MTDTASPPIARALLSVSDKTGLADLGRFLEGKGVEILSTGGSAKALSKAGVSVTEIAEYTGFPEMMDGRVKTLHPKVHGGLLALREEAAHREAMAEHGIGASTCWWSTFTPSRKPSRAAPRSRNASRTSTSAARR